MRTLDYPIRALRCAGRPGQIHRTFLVRHFGARTLHLRDFPAQAAMPGRSEEGPRKGLRGKRRAV